MFLWVLGHVSFFLGGLRFYNHCRGETLLCSSTTTLAELCVGGGRPWQRPEVARLPTCQSGGRSLGPSSTTRWHFALRGAGQPGGIGIQFGEEDFTHTWRGQLGFMEGRITLCRRIFSPCPNANNSTNFNHCREEGQDGFDHRSAGRDRSHCRGRRDEGRLVSKVPTSGGGLAPRRGGTNSGTSLCGFKTLENPRNSSLRRLCHFHSLWTSNAEGSKIPVLRADTQRIHSQRITRTCKLCSMADLFSGAEDYADYVGLCEPLSPAQLRDADRKAITDLSNSLAPDLHGRRHGKGFSFKQVEGEGHDGHKQWEATSRKLGSIPTMGLHLPSSGVGRILLEPTGALTSLGLDRYGIKRLTKVTSRTDGFGKPTGRNKCYLSTSRKGNIISTFERDGEAQLHEGSERSKKEESESGQGGTSSFSRRRQKTEAASEHQATLRWRLEQWQWTMCWIAAGASLRFKREEGAPLYQMQKPWTPFERLSSERMTQHGGAHDGEGSKETKGESSSSSSSYESTQEGQGSEGEEMPKEEKAEDEPSENQQVGKAKATSLEDYYRQRKFLFIHHFAGVNDPLTAAMEEEARVQGIDLETVSCELMSGTGDLTAAEPYNTHLSWARKGMVDAYHSGFPCTTFSRLRLREAPGMPGPLRSKDEPYGLSTLTSTQQIECDLGTVMASRSIDMAHAVATNPTNECTVPPVSTLENPPITNDKRHLAAWELPEMKKFWRYGPESQWNSTLAPLNLTYPKVRSTLRSSGSMVLCWVWGNAESRALVGA